MENEKKKWNMKEEDKMEKKKSQISRVNGKAGSELFIT